MKKKPETKDVTPEPIAAEVLRDIEWAKGQFVGWCKANASKLRRIKSNDVLIEKAFQAGFGAGLYVARFELSMQNRRMFFNRLLGGL
jgi:hypothetical protein